MRTIKFRAWDGSQIVNVDEITWTRMGILSISVDRPFNGVIVEAYKLMQFTGLLDKNGKEIYEGDIVRGQHKIIGDWTAKVDFLATGIWFGGAKFSEVENYEIIGNIYENPELLK